MARVFDELDIRDVVASMAQPTIATRGLVVVTVNEAWLRERKFRREDIEGKPILPFVQAEERDRVTQRTQLPEKQMRLDVPLQTIATTSEGRTFPVRVYTSMFTAREPPDYAITQIFAEAGSGADFAFARELLALSSELINAGSAEEVRERTHVAFERAGFTTRFVKEGAEGVDEVSRRAAVAERRPIFVGATSPAPEAVYVPLDGAEVLVVAGPGLHGQHAYAFGFFAKLISTALLDVKASEAARRKLSDTQLVLQLARTTSETLDLDALMSGTADSLVELLDVSSCFILLHDEQRNVLLGGATSRGRRSMLADIDIDIDDVDSIAATAARERIPIVIPDTAHDARAQRAPRVAELGETALAAIPIVSRGRLEGVVILDDTRGPRAFSPEWVELATAMVAQVGLSIANARLYESLRKSYDELAATRAEMVKRERLAGLGELAAIVAHEVRNPLGVIYNASSSLERLVEHEGDGKTLVNIVREECERLNQMVGDLLDFARPRTLSMQAEDVPRMLGDVVEALGIVPNVRFELTIDDDLPMLVVDRRLMRQALVNVALNGVQAMPRGGVLGLRAVAPKGEGVLLLEIADQGPGIPEANRPRIFEPFFTTKATGAGLGLAVVKRIVEDHGGQVSVAASDQGTTFSFRLPLTQSN
jgi:signal transduction histidine kinase